MYFLSILIPYIYGTLYYVSPTASYGGAGTESDPFSLTRSSEVVDAGDTVYLRGGVYNERLLLEHGITNSGAPGAWIEYTSYPGEQAILDGTGVDHYTWVGLVTIQDVSHVWFHHIDVRNSIGRGVCVRCYYSSWCGQEAGNYEPNNIRISHVNTYNTYSSGISISGRDIHVEYCQVDQACTGGTQEGISIHEIDGFIVEYCTVLDTMQETIDIKDGAENGVLRFNEVDNEHVDAGQCIYLDAWDSYIRNVSVYGNYVHCGGDGIIIGDEQGGYLEDIYVYGNVVRNHYRADFHAGAFSFGHWTDSGDNSKTNIQIYNNYFEISDRPDPDWPGHPIYISDRPSNFNNLAFHNNIIVTPTSVVEFQGNAASWDISTWSYYNQIAIAIPNTSPWFCGGCVEADYDGLFMWQDLQFLAGWIPGERMHVMVNYLYSSELLDF